MSITFRDVLDAEYAEMRADAEADALLTQEDIDAEITCAEHGCCITHRAGYHT